MGCTTSQKHKSLLSLYSPDAMGATVPGSQYLNHTAFVVQVASIVSERFVLNEVDPRETRLNSHIRTLYHQTDADSAYRILCCGQMYRGSSGIAGGGIYFALTKEATYTKAHRLGVVLSCRVRLGRVKTISPSGDSSITFTSLLTEGYDSVLIPRSAGYEYAVYNQDQVISITRDSY
jgi:hypothetical protein